MATSKAVIAIDTAIDLDWADVSGANLYSCQVSLYPDFRVNLASDNALATSHYSFTDGSTDNTKRYWRWRYSTNGGTTWSKWSEVGSYWLNTSLTTEVVPTAGKWYLIDPDDPTDIYEFAVVPVFNVVPQMIDRVKERNRLGTLMSEYLTTKDLIAMDFPEGTYIQHEQYREFVRFNNEIKTFFIVASVYDGLDYMARIWEAQFTDDPDMEHVPGRPDLLTGSLEAEEV